ncbi:MAG: glycoside hydrolase family 65 protein [Actinobacteria bacterium]|nr:glycoside hydrolase family 65 protein [Actinomycetota bacterium]
MLSTALSGEDWLIRQSGHDDTTANLFETLFTVGNGRLGTRGALEEGHPGEWSGTYLNGVFDSHDSPVTDLVNAPDWLWLEVFAGGVRLDVGTCTVVEHQRALDMARGLLWRRTTFEDQSGRITQLETLRFVSLAERSLCGLRIEVTPLNHGAAIQVVSGINGHRRNLERLPAYPAGTVFEPETRWEKWAHTKHLRETSRGYDGDTIYLEMRTAQSDVAIGCAAATRSGLPAGHAIVEQYEKIAEEFEFEVHTGQTVRLDKLVTYATSRDHPVAPSDGLDPVPDRCSNGLNAATDRGFDECLAAHSAAWEAKWAHCDCVIEGDADAAKAVRFGIYHLLISANELDPTVNIGAKSLSGEGYRGHVFWDTEVMMLPFFTYTQPETARALLRYRHHTLPGARLNAQAEGRPGARYAWESAADGREECPQWTVDGSDRLWMRDEELHVGADVAYGLMTYVAATGDVDFLTEYGAEILFETSRFWVDRLSHDPAADSFHLKSVMGPDEFHMHIDDNAFTNGLAKWHLERAVDTYHLLRDQHPTTLDTLAEKIALDSSEVDRWSRCAAGITELVDPQTGLVEQFDGYFDLLDVPITYWDENAMPQYPDGYHHFNCDTTTLLKQPDVIMLMYLLPDKFTQQVKRTNFDYYEARTLHKSSLSPSIHAIMGIEVGDHTRAEQYFARSAYVDLTDNQGNTAEGMHIASAGGTWQTTVCGFGGFRVRNGMMTFDPWLPQGWRRLAFKLHWHGQVVSVSITQRDVTLELDAAPEATLRVAVHGHEVQLRARSAVTVALAEGVPRLAPVE